MTALLITVCIDFSQYVLPENFSRAEGSRGTDFFLLLLFNANLLSVGQTNDK